MTTKTPSFLEFASEWFDKNVYDKGVYNDETSCVFCDKSKIKSATIEMFEYNGIEFMCFTPLNPIVAGHLLIVPVKHVTGASDDYTITGYSFALAAKIADKYNYENYNLIVNKGELADQTVFHLHVHIIPRSKDDETITIWNKHGT